MRADRYWGKRALDVSFGMIVSAAVLVPILLIAVLVKASSRGPVIYWSDRVGKGNNIFRMPKFRTMSISTPPVATHLLRNPDQFLTPIGGFLRKTSLDELPQIWSILRGDMSFVGPRPALFNQDDLIALRTECGVHQLTPGLTGWAQVNGRDELPISVKVEYDAEYLSKMAWGFDIKIILMTVFKVLRREGVFH